MIKAKISTHKLKIQKGDQVLVITGKERGKTGMVERVLPQKARVVVTGLNIAKRNLKKSAQNPQGGVIEVAMPIHISNVMLLDNKNKPTRIGFKKDGQKTIRVAKTTTETVVKTKKAEKK